METTQSLSLTVCLHDILSPSLSTVEEIEQMNNLFQQKQRELVMAASKVEELSLQLELLKNGKMDNFHDNQTSVAELDRLYKELQVCVHAHLCQIYKHKNTTTLQSQ